MKRTLLFGIIAALLLSTLALSTTALNSSASAAAQKSTSTPKPTRQPKATKTAQPSATATRKRPPTSTPPPTATETPAPTDQPPPTGVPAPTEVPASLSDGADPDMSEASDAVEISPVAPGPVTSQIVVFNPDTSGVATVLVEVLNLSGVSVFSTTTTVNPNGAKVIKLPGTVGSGFQGGAVVSSDKNVQALVLDANGAQTARDAYEGMSTPDTTLTLPLVRHLAPNTQNSVIAIQNTASSNASVTLSFYNAQGVKAKETTALVVPRASTYFNTTTLFGNNAFTGSLKLTSDQPIAAAVQTLLFQDTASMRALSSLDQDTTHYLNGIERKVRADGVALLWNETYARNNGSAATDITIQYFKPDGTPVFSQTAPAIPADGTASFSTDGTAFAALGANFTGWAKVTSSGQPLTLYSLAAQSRGRFLAGVSSIPASLTKNKFVCGDTFRTTAQNSKLNILNTGATTANVQVRLYDQATGAKKAQVALTVAPNASTAVSLSSSAFSAVGNGFRGLAIVIATGKNAPALAVTASAPYLKAGKPVSVTGYTCSRLP